jgi:fatty acid/phospholipid biosynthesis enzyme
MTAGPRIAIDAMGGDSGPAAMVAGAAARAAQGSVARSS